MSSFFRYAVDGLDQSTLQDLRYAETNPLSYTQVSASWRMYHHQTQRITSRIEELLPRNIHSATPPIFIFSSGWCPNYVTVVVALKSRLSMGSGYSIPFQAQRRYQFSTRFSFALRFADCAWRMSLAAFRRNKWSPSREAPIYPYLHSWPGRAPHFGQWVPLTCSMVNSESFIILPRKDLR